MKLNPQQAPLYGDCIITVLLTEDDGVTDDDVVFYLLFTGSAVQHCTSTRKVDSGTLETVAPGHDCCETVKVSLCATKQGLSALVVAEGSLQFVQDEAYDAAQFLATCAGNQQALNFTRFLDRSRPPSSDVDFLDEKVALAFRHLKLPAEWNVLGADHALKEDVPRETLMHFAVRLGLLRLTWFLLQQPGGRGALRISNREGTTPASLALERGYQKLHQILTEDGASEPDSWSTLSHTVHSGEYCVKYHRGLNVYILTTEVKEIPVSSMDDNINHLQQCMESHQHMSAREHPLPEKMTSSEDCSSGTEAKGHAATTNHALEEMITGGSQDGAPAPVALDSKVVLTPACSEEDGCKQPKGSPKEWLGLEGAENPKTSRESKNIAELHKEEGEEFSSAVDSVAVSEGNDSRLCSDVGLSGAASRPSCEHANKQAGMTSLKVSLEQGNVCDGKNLPQEVQTTDGKGAVESATEPPTSCDVGMGQAECKSCTGTAEAAASAEHCAENGERDSELPSSATSMEALPEASFLGDASGATTCKSADEVPEQSDVQVGVNMAVSPVKPRSRKPAGTDPHTDSSKEDLTKHLENCELPLKEILKAASSHRTQPGAANATCALETLPKCDLVAEVDSIGQAASDGDGSIGGEALDLGCTEWTNESDVSGQMDRPEHRCRKSSPPCASDKRMEVSAEGQDEQKISERLLLGTETAGQSCDESGTSTGLSQGALAAGRTQKKRMERNKCCGCSDVCMHTVDVSEPLPNILGPAAAFPAKEEPLCQRRELAELSCKQDQFSKSAEEILAMASALLEEVIQQAQRSVTQEHNVIVAPAGQEAPLHLEDFALPLRAKGMECMQDNLIGTPSAIHNKESKQNPEVAAPAEAATELTAVAEQGSPVPDELTTGTLCPVDLQGKNSNSSSCLQLPESELGQELPGKEEIFSEAPASAAVVQSFLCSRGEELPVSGNVETSLEGEAGENVMVNVADGVLQGLALSHDASVCASVAAFSNDMLNQELELNQDQLARFSPSRASNSMEAPLVGGEPPMVADHLWETEEVENVSSRILLHPIAEESLCDTDSGSEAALLTSESETRSEATAVQLEVLGQSTVGKGGGIQASPESQLLSHCLSAAVDLQKEGKGQEFIEPVEGVLVDDRAKIVKNSDQEAHGSLLSLAANVTDVTPVVERKSDSQHVGSLLNGETDLNLHSGNLIARAADVERARGSPVTDSLKMLSDEEMDAKNGPLDGTINRESWGPAEPSAEPKCSCHSSENDAFLPDGLSGDCAPSPESDSDLFPLPGDGLDEMDFGKQPEEEQSAGDNTSSSSSVDDTISLERNSSLGSDNSLAQALNSSRSKDRYSLNGSCFTPASAERQDSEPNVPGDLEEELDSIMEVPPLASVLNSIRPLSPFRRHSWGPGKNGSSEAEINHRSSMRVLGDGVRKPPTHRRSFSLEGLVGDTNGSKKPSSSLETSSLNVKGLRQNPLANDERGSLVSLTEEELESEQGEARGFGRKIRHRTQPRAFSLSAMPVSLPLTKSMSLMTISQSGPDTQGRIRPSRRIAFSFSIFPLIPKSQSVFSIGSSSSDEELENSRCFNSTNSSLTQSICEESGSLQPPSPSRKDLEGKSGTKVSRTFSYLRNKMSSGKKSKEKEKSKEKDKDAKEKDKDKKTINGHLFSTIPTVGPVSCYHCTKPFNKDSVTCSNCGAIIHKSCKEGLMACAKVKMKLQKGSLQAHDTSSLPTVIMRSKNSQPKERPRSAVLAPDESTMTSLFNNRGSQQNTGLSKSVSIQNIAGVGSDENILHTWRFLSHSTDSLNKICRVNESMESLTDEGADMNEDQLMGDFEMDSKQLEAQSWSQVVDVKFLRQQKKDVVKRQDVIYELMQTEMHHVRTLKIMSDVYSRGMVQELQYEQQMVEKVFPCLDDLLNIHTQFFQRILDRKKESLEDRSDKNFVIKRIGDILVNQFSGENAERMKKIYGKFCGHHNEAVNYFKDLYSKEKRFQAFIKKKSISSVVRRLGIPECILLVTQRITKYPVLLQRMLQHTKENDEEQQNLVQSLNLVKEVITAVNSKVSNYEKKMRLNEIYTRTDSKSIMRMKSGQMFAREDLRRRKFVRDGPVSLRNAAGRLKEVQAVLLSDVLIFLQEKDQKYVFASLDQRSTVISLKKLIVREVAHEEKGLFLISMGVKDPEMVEVHASSKEERNSWIQIIQDTINTMDKDEDEGIPSELEEEKRVMDTKARELKEQLHQKDQQIITLLEEKEKIFRDMTDSSGNDDGSGTRVLFRANTEEAPKGESIMKSVLSEVELLQGLVSRSLGGTVGQQMCSLSMEQEGVGPISLPRRAETFGGFDSHQMNVGKGGERDEGDDMQDLRRTESDSVLKKGGTANLMFVLKRNNEQVLQSITHLHTLLSSLQAVVVQQDTYIEDQKLLLTERTISRSSFRPNSLIEQEKQRSLEKQRQELANLQKQQAQYQEEKRKREREWEAREKGLAEREAWLSQREEQAQKGHHSLEKEREELQQRKSTYQLDLERLRAAQKQMEKEKEQLKRDMERIPQPQMEPKLSLLPNQHAKLVSRTPSMPASEDSPRQLSSSLSKQGHLDSEISVSPKRNSLSRTHKEKSAFHLLGTTTSNQTHKQAEGPGQIPNRLFGLAKPKDKKDKKKKGKGQRTQPAEMHSSEAAPEGEEIFC